MYSLKPISSLRGGFQLLVEALGRFQSAQYEFLITRVVIEEEGSAIERFGAGFVHMVVFAAAEDCSSAWR